MIYGLLHILSPSSNEPAQFVEISVSILNFTKVRRAEKNKYLKKRNWERQTMRKQKPNVSKI